mmetsp:Transcript_15082/g.34329  ORF Transcript_15082/g.34329 Transcript_15082/m.34329 type:complete len:241 (-) Transcript_15082:138-860(-)
MGFSFKSAGLIISPGGELKLPVAAVEDSVLDVQWSTEGDLEVDFSITFSPDGGDEQEILAPEKLYTRQSSVPLEGPGSCLLHWNNCYSGWLGGTARKLSYALELKTKTEIAEEERRKAEEAEAEQRRLEAIAEEERRLKAEEDARVRREQREARIAELCATAEEKRAQVEEEHSAALEAQTLADRLTAELQAATDMLTRHQVAMETLQGETRALNAELELLVAERLQDTPADDGQPDEEL